VPSALLDAGALVALLNRTDAHHQAVVDLFEGFEGTLLTTWPVIGEACALVNERRQAAVLEWIAQTDTQIISIDEGLEFMRRHMTVCEDLPCDFADASLLYAAWRTKVREVWTVDRDFMVYRLPDRSRFKVIPGRDV
jgi:predicted nucleic acid-binding protein